MFQRARNNRDLRIVVAVVDDEAAKSNSVDMAANNKFALLVHNRIYPFALSTRASSMERPARECRSYYDSMNLLPSTGLDQALVAYSRKLGLSKDLLVLPAATLRERDDSKVMTIVFRANICIKIGFTFYARVFGFTIRKRNIFPLNERTSVTA